jgi:methylmalonyl-CoA mutase N-terminal domain/subunit
MVRFHTQTGGSTLTAQQPENNIVRVALQGFAAVCGGTQSLHTNGFDEALGLPTEYSARIALRTQQVLAHESGAADTVDPFAGSYYVERLTADIESEARALMEKVAELGGSVHAIEAGFIQREIEESAFAYHQRLLTKQDILVGVNEYTEGGGEVEVDILRIDPQTEHDQVARLKRFKDERDQEAVRRRLDDLRDACRGGGNLLYPLKDALRDRATLGEVCGVMREEFGEYKPPV